MVSLGIVTIGQSPRDDLTPELAAWLPGVNLVERGVLDGLSMSDIEKLSPRPGEHALATRLSDGTGVVIGQSSVDDRLSGLVENLEPDVHAILFACTGGGFSAVPHAKPFFRPDELLTFALAGLASEMTAVGVLSPLPPHPGNHTLEKFAAKLPNGTRVRTASVSPYTGTDADLRVAARSLAADGAEVIAMDCMGFSQAMRQTVVDASGRPVLLARSVAARLCAEVLDSLAISRPSESE